MQKRVIINADDCGMSQYVNEQIEQTIISGKITSTTVMANMDDFDGALALYKKYNDHISFGWHINLTEGEPLLKSQLLLDKGYYIEVNGEVVFNGLAFWNKSLTREMKNAIILELKEQCTKLRDSGIIISHADSHQHIHTSPGLYMLMPSVLHNYGIDKCRRLRNYVGSAYNRVIRNAWTIPYKWFGLKMTDTFCAFSEYNANSSLPQGETIELMCHPGHPKKPYCDEYELLKSLDLEQLKARLITYREL